MSDRLEGSLRRLFDEIAPPIDADTLARSLSSRPLVVTPRWQIAGAGAAAALIVIGAVALWIRGGKETAPPPVATVTSISSVPSSTSTPPVSTTTLDPVLADRLGTLDESLSSSLDEVKRVNAAWEARQIMFSEGVTALTTVVSELSARTDQVASDDALASAPGLDYPRLLDALQRATSAAEAVVEGIQAPDDGTLRKEAIAALDAVIAEARGILAPFLLSSSDTTTPLTPSSTTTTRPPERVPPWTVNPVLSSIASLPPCGDVAGLTSWAAGTYPGWGGTALATSPVAVAEWLPLVVGLDAACIDAVASDTHSAWEMRDTSDALVARAAGGFGDGTGVELCHDFGPSYWQGRVGSGHWMSACLVGPRVVGEVGRILDGRWPIFELDIPSAQMPVTTLWPGGWTSGTLDLEPLMERLFLSRTDSIVDTSESAWLPARWPDDAAPCGRHEVSLGDPTVEPNGSPKVEVIELCGVDGPSYLYVRSDTSLAPPTATISSIKGIDVATWVTASGGLAVESSLIDLGYRIPHIESLRPGPRSDDLYEVLASMPGFDSRFLDPADGLGDLTSTLTEEWLLAHIAVAGWTPIAAADLPARQFPGLDECDIAVCAGLVADDRTWWVKVSPPISPGTPPVRTPIRDPLGVITYRGVDVFSNDFFAMAACGGVLMQVGSDQAGRPLDVLLPILDTTECTVG